MSRGVNKWIGIGHLGADPDVRTTNSGSSVTNLSVATSEEWKDKQSGERQSRTEWHRVSMFGKLAEIAGQYLRKGSQVYIEGRIQTRKWQGQDGQDRYTTEIVANEMKMLNSRGEPAAGAGSYRPSENPDAGRGAGNPAQSSGGEDQSAPDDFDDDIAF